jgi:hypothetical protein
MSVWWKKGRAFEGKGQGPRQGWNSKSKNNNSTVLPTCAGLWMLWHIDHRDRVGEAKKSRNSLCLLHTEIFWLRFLSLSCLSFYDPHTQKLLLFSQTPYPHSPFSYLYFILAPFFLLFSLFSLSRPVSNPTSFHISPFCLPLFILRFPSLSLCSTHCYYDLLKGK